MPYRAWKRFLCAKVMAHPSVSHPPPVGDSTRAGDLRLPGARRWPLPSPVQSPAPDRGLDPLERIVRLFKKLLAEDFFSERLHVPQRLHSGLHVLLFAHHGAIGLKRAFTPQQDSFAHPVACCQGSALLVCEPTLL